MSTKTLYIDSKLHRQVKLSATMHGVSIKEYVERVLQNAIAAEGLTLVDPGVEYTTEGEDNA